MSKSHELIPMALHCTQYTRDTKDEGKIRAYCSLYFPVPFKTSLSRVLLRLSCTLLEQPSGFGNHPTMLLPCPWRPPWTP